MIELLTNPAAWMAFISLAALEIVLGIDNIVFIAILTDRLPEEQRKLAYQLGLGAAMFSRIALLLAINWLIHLEADLFSVVGQGFSGRELILLAGGVFLIGKSAHEIYEKVEDDEDDEVRRKARGATMASVISQIAVLDIIFSLDSVITAVGIADDIEVMVAAIVLAVLVMLLFAKPVGDFVNRNPSMQVLALSFLLLIGVLLTAEAFGQHVDKAYIYFAMGFAFTVELINLRVRRREKAARAAVAAAKVEAAEP